MNIVADERCDALLVSALRSDGHDVLYVKEASPGSDDTTVLQISVNEQRILLTEDKGRSLTSIATGGRVLLEENFGGGAKAEARAGAVVE